MSTFVDPESIFQSPSLLWQKRFFLISDYSCYLRRPFYYKNLVALICHWIFLHSEQILSASSILDSKIPVQKSRSTFSTPQLFGPVWIWLSHGATTTFNHPWWNFRQTRLFVGWSCFPIHLFRRALCVKVDV